MTQDCSPQEEAEALLEHITTMKNGLGKLDKDLESHGWMNVDYRDVSTETCEAIRGLIHKPTKYRGFSANVPETPPRMQLVRQLDCVITKRWADASQRVLDAQNLPKILQDNMVPVCDFLRAACRAGQDDINFPIPAFQLLQHIEELRKALVAVENMAFGNTDADITEPDTDYGDADETRVEFRGSQKGQ